MSDNQDPAGMAALSICEALLLAMNDRKLLPEPEIVGVLRDAAATHENAEGRGAEKETHAAAASLITEIIVGETCRAVRSAALFLPHGRYRRTDESHFPGPTLCKDRTSRLPKDALDGAVCMQVPQSPLKGMHRLSVVFDKPAVVMTPIRLPGRARAAEPQTLLSAIRKYIHRFQAGRQFRPGSLRRPDFCSCGRKVLVPGDHGHQSLP